MTTLRHGFLPILIGCLLLLQYAAVEHVLAHMGLGGAGVWAGAPFADGDTDPDQQPGGCEAPQLHAVIDGSPHASPVRVVLIDTQEASHAAFWCAVADRTTPHPHSRGPPQHSL